MIIRQLQLTNFQGYENETIELHPYFNCFVGTGHAGKSSIIRALSFLLYGIWNSKWVRWDQDYAEVTLTTDDGTVITRQKGEKVNKFILTLPNGKPQVYENFGKDTPEEIEAITKVFKADIGGKDELLLNLSSQHDPLFLLSQPGSFKAKTLGKLSGGHFLDYALKEINKDKKNLASEKRLKEVDVLEAERQLSSYIGLDEKKKNLDNAGIRISRAEQRIRHVENLKKLNEQVQAWKDDYTKETNQEAKLSAFSDQVTTTLFEKIEKHKKLVALNERLSHIDDDTAREKEALHHTKGYIETYVDKYFTLLKENKKCPTCFTEIDIQQLEKIKANL